MKKPSKSKEYKSSNWVYGIASTWFYEIPKTHEPVETALVFGDQLPSLPELNKAIDLQEVLTGDELDRDAAQKALFRAFAQLASDTK